MRDVSNPNRRGQHGHTQRAAPPRCRRATCRGTQSFEFGHAFRSPDPGRRARRRGRRRPREMPSPAPHLEGHFFHRRPLARRRLLSGLRGMAPSEWRRMDRRLFSPWDFAVFRWPLLRPRPLLGACAILWYSGTAPSVARRLFLASSGRGRSSEHHGRHRRAGRGGACRSPGGGGAWRSVARAARCLGRLNGL